MLDTLKQHYFIDRYPWIRRMMLIVSENVKEHNSFSNIIMVSWKMVIIIFISSLQRWRNVPAHLKLYADWPSDPPRELHQCGTLAGGGKVLRASWSVLHPSPYDLDQHFYSAELVSYLEGLQRGVSSRISPVTNGASSPPHLINGPAKTSRKGQVMGAMFIFVEIRLI